MKIHSLIQQRIKELEATIEELSTVEGELQFAREELKVCQQMVDAPIDQEEGTQPFIPNAHKASIIADIEEMKREYQLKYAKSAS